MDIDYENLLLFGTIKIEKPLNCRSTTNWKGKVKRGLLEFSCIDKSKKNIYKVIKIVLEDYNIGWDYKDVCRSSV